MEKKERGETNQKWCVSLLFSFGNEVKKGGGKQSKMNLEERRAKAFRIVVKCFTRQVTMRDFPKPVRGRTTPFPNGLLMI